MLENQSSVHDSPESMSLLSFFEYAHLPPALQSTSKMFADLAAKIIDDIPCHFERTAGLRKLLEAKDCAVRAVKASKSSMESR